MEVKPSSWALSSSFEAILQLNTHWSNSRSAVVTDRCAESFACCIVPQGSITIDGISLTIARWNARIAEVAVIPFTYEHTNIRHKKIGDAVNLEGDVLGKYVERYLEARGAAKPATHVTVEQLVSQGF